MGAQSSTEAPAPAAPVAPAAPRVLGLHELRLQDWEAAKAQGAQGTENLQLEQKPKWERYSGHAVWFLVVLAISSTVPVPEFNDISVAFLMCSSMIAGFAGSYLWSRAATRHARSTAGFLLLTWIVGLAQTGQQGSMDYLSAKYVLVMTFAVVEALSRAAQVIWVLYLPLQRLHALQLTAGTEFIPIQQLKIRVRRVGYVYAPACALLSVFTILWLQSISIYDDHFYYDSTWRNCQSVAQAIVQPLWIYILFVYGQVMTACKQIAQRLKNTMKVVEISSSSEACYEAFKMAQRSITMERWGLRVIWTSTVLLGNIVAFATDLLDPASKAGGYVRAMLLLVNIGGAWFLANAHGMSKEKEFGFIILFALVFGLLFSGFNVAAISFVLCPLFLLLALFACIIGNAHRLQKRINDCVCRLQERFADSRRSGMEAEWRKKVTSLSRRGITARSLIHFYKRLGQDLMPHYQAAVHTTNDVVRQAIIPFTKEMRCAYAELEGPLKAEKMVTHSWQNLFCDLIAAVIADAVQETSFDLVSSLLESDASILETLLEQKGTADNVYWICAFSVNQHAGICGGNPKQDRDSLTGQVHETCDCGLPKMFNNTPPLAGNGESIGCEMNKFDDMMALLAAGNPDFAQVVAVDTSFGLFGRAWCVAELVKADETKLKQHVKMHSMSVLKQRAGGLRNLRVQDMQASRPEDVDYILSRIDNKEEFNRKLQRLIFDKAGLLSTWCHLDASRRMEEVGNLLKWGLADDGKGEVWQFWNKWT